VMDCLMMMKTKEIRGRSPYFFNQLNQEL